MPTNSDLAQKHADTVKRGGKADGETVFTGALNEYTAPALTPELAYRYLTQNIHLRNNLVNMQAQIFPEEPVIEVIGIDEVVDEVATDFIRRQWYSVQGYPSMQRTWLDCMGFGCSVKSPGYAKKGSQFVLTEIRDLPAISFREGPNAKVTNGVANGLMPGIIYDEETQEVQVWQTSGTGLKKTELKNFVIIRDPATPSPAGLAYCLPCYPVISAIDNANKAADQQVMRTGAPLIFPQVTTLSSDLQKWGEQFIKRWGKNVGFVLPPGVTFANPMIHESDSANVRLDKLIKWIDGYFNPTTVLRKEGSTIGGTDLAMMAIWNNYIGGTQAWLEYAYEEMLNPVLRANAYDDLYVRIRLTRPSIDRSQIRAEQLKIGISHGALTKRMVYENLSDLTLPEWSDDIAAELAAVDRPLQNPFGQFQFGNVSDGECDWITINGTHICIREGETVGSAFKRTTGKSMSGSSSDVTIHKPNKTGGKFYVASGGKGEAIGLSAHEAHKNYRTHLLKEKSDDDEFSQFTVKSKGEQLEKEMALYSKYNKGKTPHRSERSSAIKAQEDFFKSDEFKRLKANIPKNMFGNVAKPDVEKTEPYLDNEDKLLAAIRQVKRDVTRIVGEMPVEREDKPWTPNPKKFVNVSDEGTWVTINGTHILIKEGETAGDAFKRTTGKELSGRGATGKTAKIQTMKSGESVFEKEVYRAKSQDSSHFAAYDSEGNRIGQGQGSSFVTPTEDELSVWDAQLKEHAGKIKLSGGEKTEYGLIKGKEAVRYFSKEDPMSDYGHAMFVDAEKEARLGEGFSYGGREGNRFVFDKTKGTDISSIKKDIIKKWDSDAKAGLLPRGFEDISGKEAYRSFSPIDIVDSADAWDTGEMTQWFYERVASPKNIMAINTPDGSIVFDKKLIKHLGKTKGVTD